MKLTKKKVFGAVAALLIIAGLYVTSTVVAQPEVYLLGSEYLVFNGDGGSIIGEYPDPEEGEAAASSSSVTREIVIGYTCTATDVWFKEILPTFAKNWQQKTGEKVIFTTGWNAVGPDSVATTIYGKPAEIEIVISTLDGSSRGFYNTKWKAERNDVVYSTPQVFIVREGNPKNILTYDDLARPEVQVLHVDPFGTHGGINTAFALYGAILKESEEKTDQKDYARAHEFVKLIEEKAITRFSGSMVTELFEAGIGDVMLTSEPKSIRMDRDPRYEMVIPPNTFSLDLIAYKIRKNIPSKDRELINAFIDYIFSEEVQEAFARGGFRPSDPEVLARHPKFRPMPGAVNIDYLGGDSSKIKKDLLLGSALEARNKNQPDEQKIKVRKLRPSEMPDFSSLPTYQQVPD